MIDVLRRLLERGKIRDGRVVGKGADGGRYFVEIAKGWRTRRVRVDRRLFERMKVDDHLFI